MVLRRRFSAALAPLLTVAVAACGGGPTKHELYMEGMKIEGEASRGACQPAYDPGKDTRVLDGDIVQGCLRRTEEALALYEQAEAKGFADHDFLQTLERARERQRHLRSMLKVIRDLEQPDGVYPGAPPEAGQRRD